jgi:hypothetical protein
MGEENDNRILAPKASLDRTNYHQWAPSMKLYLAVKKVWHVVESSFELLSDEALESLNKAERKTYEDKLDKDVLARALIMSCVAGGAVPLPAWTEETAGQIWGRLKDAYGMVDKARLMDMHTQMLSYRHPDGESIAKLLSKMEGFQSQLLAGGQTVDDEELVLAILQSLKTTEGYGANLSNLRTMQRKGCLSREELVAELFHLESTLPAPVSHRAMVAYGGQGDSAGQVSGGSQAGGGGWRSGGGGFGGQCFRCQEFGHRASRCRAPAPVEPTHKSGYGRGRAGGTAPKALLMQGGADGVGWYMDGGASDHVAQSKRGMVSYRELGVPMSVGTAEAGKEMLAVGKGVVNLRVSDGRQGATRTLQLTNTLHVPTAGANLVSVSRLDKEGKRVLYGEGKCQVVSSDGDVLAVGQLVDGLYRMDPRPMALMARSNPQLLALWHARLGHISQEALITLSRGAVIGMPTFSNTKLPFCRACAMGKQCRGHHPTNSHKVTEALDRVHSDILGPVRVEGADDEDLPVYVVTFLDEATHYLVVELMQSKGELLSKFRKYVMWAKAQKRRGIKALRCDNGAEYTSRAFKKLCEDEGISVEYSAPYTPKSNGVAERINRTLEGTVRCLREQGHLDDWLWPELLDTATFLLNRTPSSAIQVADAKTPFEAWNGRKPSVKHLRVIGCRAYPMVPPKDRTKFGTVATEGVLVGYSGGGYRIYLPEEGRVIVSRHATFDESIRGTPDEEEWTPRDQPLLFPDDSMDEAGEAQAVAEGEVEADALPNEGPVEPVAIIAAAPEEDAPEENQEVGGNALLEGIDVAEQDGRPGDGGRGEAIELGHDVPLLGDEQMDLWDGASEVDVLDVEPLDELLVNGPRPRAAPNRREIDVRMLPHAEDEVVDPNVLLARGKGVASSSGSSGSSGSVAPGIRGPVGDVSSSVPADSQELVQEDPLEAHGEPNDFPRPVPGSMVPPAPSVPDPTSVAEAMGGIWAGEWSGAMDDEMMQMHALEVYELVDLPPGKRAIGCRWVFKTKRNALGEIERFKSRLCAKGFTMRPGIDFLATFAPVSGVTTLRIVIVIATALDWEMLQLDVTTAFLYGHLDEEVYMRQPEGYVVAGQEDKVWRLRKALYGTKQAPRCWNQRINAFMLEHGFYKSQRDPCLYIKWQGKGPMLVVLYVDDMLVAGPDAEMIRAFKKQLMDEFKIKDLGEPKVLLGLHITRDRARRQLDITLESYLREVVDLAGMWKARPQGNPLPPGTKLLEEAVGAEAEAVDVTRYRQLLGKLSYAAQKARPDLSVVVGLLAKFQSKPLVKHWDALLHAVCYVRETLSHGLHFDLAHVHSNPSALTLSMFADADYANSPDRKAISGIVLQLGGATISWSSKRQSIVTTSTLEAELVAAARACKEVVWARGLLQEVGLQQHGATPMWEDNQGCIAVCQDASTSTLTRHLEVQYFFTREKIRTGAVDMRYIPTQEQLADLLTKPLERTVLRKLRAAVGVVNASSSPSGSVGSRER